MGQPSRRALAAALVGLAFGAFLPRALLVDRPSAYMDEVSFILTGRTLIEQQVVYARALDWTFGSLLWPLIAGLADRLGGLSLVRLVTAGLGAVMALATALAAIRLGPADRPARWTGALLAGALMALLPTSITVGRLGTYDAMAGACFFGSVAVLARGPRQSRRVELLAGAALLFASFLSKYITAIFFPFICVFFVAGSWWPGRDWRSLARVVAWFVGPLTAACAIYALVLREELQSLLSYASGYSDLRSPDPLRDYVFGRIELWLVFGLAVLGCRQATPGARVAGLGGSAILLGFQTWSRADADFWKHSIYLIFFLALLAGPVLGVALLKRASSQPRWIAAGLVGGIALVTPLFLALARTGLLPDWRLGTVLSDRPVGFVLATLVAGGLVATPALELLLERRRAAQASVLPGPRAKLLALVRWARPAVLALGAGAGFAWLIGLSQARSGELLSFYPDLTSSGAALSEYTAGARFALVDDTAVRYYLASDVRPEMVADPFASSYGGLTGIEASRLAITARAFDAIVLDGGVGPIGQSLRRELGPLIPRYYERVFALNQPTGPIEIFHPRAAPLEPAERPLPSGAIQYTFGEGTGQWGGHPSDGDVQPGLQVGSSPNPAWRGQPSLAFTVTDRTSLLAVKRSMSVSRLVAQVYLVPRGASNAGIRIGVVGFDRQWAWRDDGFDQVLPVGQWVEVSWEPGANQTFEEIGFKLPSDQVATCYLGEVTVEP